ncbi:hypothetical protein LSH36_354g01007 [Paralvinella palmiformis]|uniref:Homeobox domain-containing protein n=1 Tax=Paralvinella palmiformis TaxID=53620 RepID=A0AAD9MZZ7_9ANNE|nr:hypothetical protein LSH36_354g01007 [Paralvinella palmiformis]
MARLEKWFSENPYPGIEDRERYSAEISVDEARIHVWFQNRRSRCRRQTRHRHLMPLSLMTSPLSLLRLPCPTMAGQDNKSTNLHLASISSWTPPAVRFSDRRLQLSPFRLPAPQAVPPGSDTDRTFTPARPWETPPTTGNSHRSRARPSRCILSNLAPCPTSSYCNHLEHHVSETIDPRRLLPGCFSPSIIPSLYPNFMVPPIPNPLLLLPSSVIDKIAKL